MTDLIDSNSSKDDILLKITVVSTKFNFKGRLESKNKTHITILDFISGNFMTFPVGDVITESNVKIPDIYTRLEDE